MHRATAQADAGVGLSTNDDDDTTLALDRAEEYVSAQAGETPASRVAAIEAIYGADRTFAAPILANCALAGLVPWESVAGLPFELAAIPHQLHRLARMEVVSYALPALVAVGVLLHQKSPAANPLTRWVRNRAKSRALAAIAAMQPERGGFLEAAPLTGSVAMSLAAALGPDHPVVARCLEFLRGGGPERLAGRRSRRRSRQARVCVSGRARRR